jgi:hypothetical protein
MLMRKKRYDSRMRMTSYISLTSHLRERLGLLRANIPLINPDLQPNLRIDKNLITRGSQRASIRRMRAEKVDCGSPVFVKVG